METQSNYTAHFFQRHLRESLSSAENVIPLVMGYVQPESVIDIGCGIGTWLSVWNKKGVADVRGVDGNYVNTDDLLIQRENFSFHDLERGYESDRRYDLVSCLEVAEHISADSAANLVHSLCNLGDVVLFSAAIPGQGGTDHINEQYPDYWSKLFAAKGYVPVDCLRKAIWSNNKISFWYRQNIMFYVKRSSLANHEKLSNEALETNQGFLNIVHPEQFNKIRKELSASTAILVSKRKTFSYLVKKFLGKA